jgi:hypothetical protein
MIYYGDFAVGATLYASFNTVNAVGAPTSFDASSVVKVYKKGSGAESTAGVTLNADFDGRSGMHELEIDTSADGTFYDAGSDFYAVLTTGAVGGVGLVGLIVAHFSIAARSVISAAAIRSALGLGSANLDTQLSGVPAAVRDVSNSSPAAGSFGEAARNADAKAAVIIGTIGTPAGATVSDDIAAIGVKTDNLPASPAATSDIPTANQNADALLDRANAIETSVTPRGALRIALAALAGKLSGAAGTTVTIRNVGDSKDRITATVDSNGNRTAVSTDAT